MNSGSEQKCSIEELKEKNLPPERHPTAEEWGDLLAILSALYRLTAGRSDMLKSSLSTMRTLHTQAEALTKEATAIRQLLERQERAGKKKERRLSLPRIHLPQPSLAWLWAIPILVTLLVIWFAGAAIWNNLLRPFLQLIQ